MFNFKKNTAAIAAAICLAAFLPLTAQAADHGDATVASADPSADLADVFAFISPTDPSKVILAMDFAGFIVPSQLLNFGFFSPDVVYRLEIENTGDAKPDLNIDITFSAQTARNVAQTATIRFPKERRRQTTFTAPTTVQTLAATANPFAVTDLPNGVRFFAGLTDDPFNFDIVGVNRFVGSVLAGAPNATFLNRGRDSFAGYNIHMIALEVPRAMLQGPAGNIIGVNGVTLRSKSARDDDDDDDRDDSSRNRFGKGNLVQIDRAATPAVNVLLIPFPRKNEHNEATPRDDAEGLFAGSIVSTLTALGTSPANIAFLASVAVTRGDYLRLNLDTPPNALGFGERFGSPGYVGFPNGRRPGDDVVDTLLQVITNGGLTTGDNVNQNEVSFGTVFPFFAPPHQPFASGTADDRTRN